MSLLLLLGQDGAVSATLAATETPDVAAAVAQVWISGALALTETADAAALTAQVQVSGSFALTDPADAATVSAQAWLSATLAASETPDTADIAGEVLSGFDIEAILDATESPDVAGFNVLSEQPVFFGGGHIGAPWQPPSAAITARLRARENPDRCRMRAEVDWSDSDEAVLEALVA